MKVKKECGREMETYARVCGFYRPVQAWNKGKREEFRLRKTFKLNDSTTEPFEEGEREEKKSKLTID